MSLVMFPKLALGLSGFETGVAVMPLVRGEGKTPDEILQSRIANTQKLLATAAFIMSVLLIGSSLVTTTMIPPEEFARGGRAEGRALAFLAHRDIGEPFATLYDLATIGTLWFAGSSALAGLLNLVPQYLPRYGMAPDWARATRPLVLLLTGVCLVVTVIFEADVTAQAGAYATGVLALMTSAALAVAIGLPRQRWYFAPIAIIFAYTTLVNVYEQPEGIQIAGWFIISIIGASLVSRVMRSTEVRIESVEYDATAGRFVNDAVGQKAIRIVASRPNTGRPEEYARKFAAARDSHHLPDEGALFLEVTPGDASDFTGRLAVVGVEIGGYRILRCKSPAVPNAIAGLLLDLRDRTDAIPHAYFGWTEGNPIAYLLKFLAFGEGDTAPVCREVLRKAEPDPEPASAHPRRLNSREVWCHPRLISCISPILGSVPVSQPLTSSNKTTGLGLFTSRNSAPCTVTPNSTIRGSSGVPWRASPSSSNHIFQSGAYSSRIFWRSFEGVAIPDTETHSELPSR